MTPEQIERLEELEKRATPGEWVVYDSNSWRRIGLKGSYREILWPCKASADGHPELSGVNRDNDLAFLMALRNAWPAIREALSQRTEAGEDEPGEIPFSLRSPESARWQRYARGLRSQLLAQAERADNLGRYVKAYRDRAEAAEERIGELRAQVEKDGNYLFGSSLAMKVLQSDLYKTLADAEREECDELAARWYAALKVRERP